MHQSNVYIPNDQTIINQQEKPPAISLDFFPTTFLFSFNNHDRERHTSTQQNSQQIMKINKTRAQEKKQYIRKTNTTMH